MKMNLQYFLEKLNGSVVFKEFIKSHADAFLAGGFFVIDLSETSKVKDKKYHLDYFIPTEKRMISFQLESGIQVIEVELYDKDVIPAKVSGKSITDFKEIENMIKERMEKEKIDKKLQKIIMSLQNVESRDVWICTAFISGMGLLKVMIDDQEKKIIDFEKKSFFDLMRKG